MKTLAALALVPVLAGPSLAGGYFPVYYPPKQVVVKEKVVVVEKPVIVREAVSYLATIIPSPTYNITTNLPATPPVQQAQLTANFGYGAAAVTSGGQSAAVAGGERDALAAALTKINDRLCKLEEAVGVKADPFALKAAPKVFGKCATCHDAAAAQQKGGGFVLSEGGAPKKLTERQLLAVHRHAMKGTMPPPGNAAKVAALTESELNELLDWVASQK